MRVGPPAGGTGRRSFGFNSNNSTFLIVLSCSFLINYVVGRSFLMIFVGEDIFVRGWVSVVSVSSVVASGANLSFTPAFMFTVLSAASVPSWA